jgi:hypothetical protein
MKTTIAAGSLAFVLALAGGVPLASAADVTGDPSANIVGGSALLDAGRAAQLGRWLGAGDIQLSNVYTRKPGDTSLDFHQAADGKGATFTLLEVSNPAGNSYLVGGYDPQSWSSTDGWHQTPLDWQRSAFLFNMSTPAVYRQILSTYILPSQGLRQTFNEASLGPVFGAGPDLYVDGSLDAAISWQLGYGSPSEEGLSIIDRSRGGENVRVDALEVFTVSPVPEPLPAAMLLLGAGVLALRARALGRGSAVTLSLAR